MDGAAGGVGFPVKLFPSPDVWNWTKSLLVGKVDSLPILWNLVNLKDTAGCDDFKLRFIGELYVLVEFVNEELAEKFLSDTKATWSNWFFL